MIAEMESVTFELPKVALKWIQKIVEAHGKFDSVQQFLQYAVIDQVSIWLSDEEGDLSEITALDIIKDGFLDVCDKWDTNHPRGHCFDVLSERLRGSKI